MTTFQNRISLPGSELTPVVGAKTVGQPDPNEKIEVTVVLRSQKQLPEGDALTEYGQNQKLSRE